MRAVLTTTLLCLAVAFSSNAARAHAKLTKAAPAAGSSVKAPAEVVLDFSENLEAAFSTIQVRDARGERADTGRSSVSGNRLRVQLKPLAPGRYGVRWRVLSVDTHRSEDNFSFDVSP